MKLLKLTTICITLCILSAFFTFCVTNAFLSNNQSKPANQKEQVEDLYASQLTFSKVFKKCGHTENSLTSGTVTYSSTEELLKRFPGHEITSGGEDNKIVLSAKIDNFCSNHFSAVLLNDEITITRLSDNEIISTVKIISHSLSKEEKSLLEQGITLDSQKALSSFIEDFTS